MTAQHVESQAPVDMATRAREAIDAAVVDGMIDSGSREVVARSLAKIAFAGDVPGRREEANFLAAVRGDSRYQGKRVQPERNVDFYIFDPTVTPGSDRRPSWRAIVTGSVPCTAEERAEAETALKRAADVVISHYKRVQVSRRGVLNVYDINDVLSGVDTNLSLSYGQMRALFEYLRLSGDSRFYVPAEGDLRLVVAEAYRGDPAKLPPLRKVLDIKATLGPLLNRVKKDGDGTFTRTAVFRALIDNGWQVTYGTRLRLTEEVAKMYDCSLGLDGRFQYTPRASKMVPASPAGKR